jgi:hypothetical protein
MGVLPVLGLAGRVDALAGRMARRAAGHRADRAADQHADRSERSADGCADGSRAGRADAGADRVRAGLASDGVAIHISVFRHSEFLPCCQSGR